MRGRGTSAFERGTYYFWHLVEGEQFNDIKIAFEEFKKLPYIPVQRSFITLSNSYFVEWEMTLEDELPDINDIISTMNGALVVQEEDFFRTLEVERIATVQNKFVYKFSIANQHFIRAERIKDYLSKLLKKGGNICGKEISIMNDIDIVFRPSKDLLQTIREGLSKVYENGYGGYSITTTFADLDDKLHPALRELR